MFHRTWHRLRFMFRPCPIRGVFWIDKGIPSAGDCSHDVYRGRCGVCGAVHWLEQGRYWCGDGPARDYIVRADSVF